MKELADKRESINLLHAIAAKRPLTLHYSARDPDHIQAVAPKEYLLRRCEW